MKKKLFLIILILYFLFAGPIAIMADVPPKGKLGSGFEPGLVPGKDFVEGSLIVGIKKGMGIQNIKQAASKVNGTVVKTIRGAILLSFPSEGAVMDAVNILINRPDVAFVERNGFMSIPPEPKLPDLKGQKHQNIDDQYMDTEIVSSDAGTGYQWHHTVIRKTATLPALSSTPPTVAVLDTGVDYTHPDLSGKVILGKNCVNGSYDPYDDHGHGTHVAGIIAAKGGNGLYGEGVSPNSKILAVKVLSAEGWGTWFDIAAGMQYARTKVTTPATKIINMSLGGGFSSLIATEVDAIKAAGKVLVAAAGNSNTTSTTSAFPGADPDTALRVMATEENDYRAWFSNFSPSDNPGLYNIAAPGWQILSTMPMAGYASMSGTSMASPVVAGAAALVWGQIPALTRAQVVTRLTTYGTAITGGFAAATKRVNVRNAIYGNSETVAVGRILDPFSGKAPSSPLTPANARLFSGATQLKTDQTNTGGSYEMTGLANGTGRILKGDRTDYVNAVLRKNINIASGKIAGPFTDALPRSRATGDATITLDWAATQPVTNTTGCTGTCNGWEFDLITKLPSGTYIYFDNNGDLMTSPYVFFPRDSFSDLEPTETSIIGNSAADGVYKIIVQRYSTSSQYNPSWTNSKASVQMYNGAASIGTFYAAPPGTCGSYKYWHVGNLTKTGTSYAWTNINTCSDTVP